MDTSEDLVGDGHAAAGRRRPLRPLRVLHVDSGQEWQATRDQVELLVGGLRGLPVRQAVATLSRSRLAVRSAGLGIPIAPLPWSAGTDPRALRTLARLVRRKWDVFHAHDTHALRLLLYLVALGGLSTRLVASRRLAGPPASPWKWRRAHLVLAVTESIRRGLLARGVERRRIRIVHDGIQPERLEPQETGALRAAAGARPGHRLVGTVTRLEPDRDLDSLLEAAAIVVARHPDARFAIFGEGPRRRALENRIEALDLGGRVCLPGYVTDARMALRDLDVFVMPSRGEGELTVAGLEAMALGVPTVPIVAEDDATEVRAAGLEPVPPRRPGDLAAAIGALLTGAAERRGTAEAGRRCAREYSVQAMVDRTFAAYRTVCRTL